MMSGLLYFSFHFIGKNFPLLYIILIVVVAVILIVVSVVVIVVIVVLLRWWKRQKDKNCDKTKTIDEETPLLEESELPCGGKLWHCQVYCKNN